MHIKKTIVILLVLLLSVIPAFCLSSLREVLPDLSEEQIQKLLEGGTIEAYTVGGEKTSSLAAKNSIAYNMAFDTENLDYAFSQALVSFVPYNDKFTTMSEEEAYLEVFNTMQKISTVVGITYRSTNQMVGRRFSFLMHPCSHPQTRIAGFLIRSMTASLKDHLLMPT